MLWWQWLTLVGACIIAVFIGYALRLFEDRTVIKSREKRAAAQAELDKRMRHEETHRISAARPGTRAAVVRRSSIDMGASNMHQSQREPWQN